VSGSTRRDAAAQSARTTPPRPRDAGQEGLTVEQTLDGMVFGTPPLGPGSTGRSGPDLQVIRRGRPGRTDPFAVASLVCGVVALAPVAIVLGVVAVVRTKRHGVAGRRLAITGIALGVLWSVAFLAVFVFAVLLGHRVVTSVHDLDLPAAGAPSLDAAGTTKSASEVAGGECLLAWDARTAASDEDQDVVVVDCATPHQAQAFGRVDLSETFPADQAYPGAAAVVGPGSTACSSQVAESLDPALAGALPVSAIVPTRADWDRGSRDVTCVVASVAADLTTSVSS